ncbi:hypothetical protein A1O1_03205 [Capronia coronata CBS 617.96]|uniref:Uncharacterized protein n=1 Tax=Capronia coronata CBS 617.96 TaxID=1182541 RepID=W9YPF3_9EURO|nr:uncharacterized protein A1O1_03205 [Capronia coronata CBS 617.96]EXJ94807.1 hypothetical protein A1O1_03205 [Capronia coronata CBS 617.96]
MPKILKGTRQTPRQTPYCKQAAIQARKTPQIFPQRSRFLELPLEVRLSLYSYFIDIPLTIGCGYDYTNKEMVLARKTLLLVCRQMHEEWAPLFFRSTTVVVNTLKEEFRANHGPGVEKSWLIAGSSCIAPTDFHNASGFGNVFLKCLDPYKLRNLRSLKFDATVWTRAHSYRPQSRHPYVDFQGLRDLGRVLQQHKDIFVSLEEVTLREKRWCDFANEYPTFPVGCDAVTQARTVWSVASLKGGMGCRGEESAGKKSECVFPGLERGQTG